MKNRLNKLLCLLLALSMLLCMFTVFASAEEGAIGEEEATGPKVDVFVNRTFEEGWELLNGFSHNGCKNQKFELDYELGNDFKYNYFGRATAMGDGDGYYQLSYNGAYNSQTTYLEFSIKTDDYADQLGTIVYFRNNLTSYDPSYNTPSLFVISNNALYAWGTEYKIGDVGNNKWYNFVVRYDSFDENTQTDLISLYTIDDLNDYDPDSLVPVFENKDLGVVSGIECIRFNISPINISPREQQSWCFDNLRMYSTTFEDRSRVDISEMGYGSNTDANATHTVPILSYTAGKNKAFYINEALYMKVGVNYALEKNKREPLFDGTYGAPVRINGTVYLPLEPILDYLGYTCTVHSDGISYDISNGKNTVFLTLGREFASVDGKRIPLSAPTASYTDPKANKSYSVIAMDDFNTLFPSYYVTWDDVGLIAISDWCDRDYDGNVTDTRILTRESDSPKILSIMKAFIYDCPTGKQVYEDVKENTNNFERPYMMVRQSTFDYLYAAWTANPGDENYDANLKTQMKQVVAEADRYYREYSNVDAMGNYIGKKKAVTNPYATEENGYYGYDPYAGRLNQSSENTNKIMLLAMAYNVTRNVNYAKAAHDYMIDMGEWEHWGPGHFLNCADATTPYALAFDWLYNIFEELGYDTYQIAAYLYNRGVYEGYCSVIDEPNLYNRPSDSSGFSGYTNNWNAVCTAGMTIGALALMPYARETKDENGNQKYTEAQLWDSRTKEGKAAYWEERVYKLLESNLWNLGYYGLDVYYPDGSYPEGTGYWGYATNNVFRMSAALDYAAGDNYGYMDTWTMDQTSYFALYTEPSTVWNYNDGPNTYAETCMFNYVAQYYGVQGLAAVRSVQIANGKPATVYDLLFYQPVDLDDQVELSLDYHLKSIDGAVTRSTWEKDGIFAGMLGGGNSVAHADVDSGNFLYEAGGVRWFVDLGSENYNVYNYFDMTGSYNPSNPSRFCYFRKNAEGNNVVFMTSMQSAVPYGQDVGGGGKVTSFISNEYGSATIIDNTSAYGGYAISAKRGMLMTNDRTTVVYQDEITMNSMQRLVWSAISGIGPTILNGGRTAVFASAGRFLRVTLVSDNENLKFEMVGCEKESDYFLDSTLPTGSEATYGGESQYARSNFSRLVIDAGLVMTFSVAVVIEYFGETFPNNTHEVKYDWVDMSKWEPTKEYVAAEEVFVRDAKKGDMPSYAKDLDKYSNNGTKFSTNLENFYDNLAKIDQIMLAFDIGELTSEQNTAYEKWLVHAADYDNFVKFFSTNTANARKIMRSLLGF